MPASRKIISRLCRYRNLLLRYKDYKTDSIFSEEIAAALKLTSAQVRKDFSFLSIPGRKKAGYRVDNLLVMFNRILDKTSVHKAIVAGINPLGLSLLQEPVFADHNIHLSAAFGDLRALPPSAPKDFAFPVYSYSELIPFVRRHKIRHAVLAVTSPTAQQALDLLLLAGIRSIFSLSPWELKVPRDCVYSSVNLVNEFEKLVYFTAHEKPKH